MEVEAQAGAPETPEQFVLRRDNAIKSWLEMRGMLESIKPQELAARNDVTTVLFPTPKKGTNRYYLNNGYAIKLLYGTNYTLGDKDLIKGEGEDAVKVPVSDQVDEVLDKIALIDTAIADDLVKWKPELNEKFYLTLPEDSEIKKLIDGILTTKPATPQLTFEEPKTK